MVNVSQQGKFELKIIDTIESMRISFRLFPFILSQGEFNVMVHEPFCERTLEMLDRWKEVDPKIFDIAHESLPRLSKERYQDAVEASKKAFSIVRDYGRSWTQTTTLTSFIERLPTVTELLKTRSLRVSCSLMKGKEQEKSEALQKYITEGQQKSWWYHEYVRDETLSLTQEKVRHTLYAMSIHEKMENWSYEGLMASNLEDRAQPRSMVLKGLLLYGLALGMVELPDEYEINNLATQFFKLFTV